MDKTKLRRDSTDSVRYKTTNTQGEVTKVSLLELGSEDKAVDMLIETIKLYGDVYEKDVNAITEMVKDVFKENELETII